MEMNFKIGANLGSLMLEIAQTNIKNNKFHEAEAIYVDGLHGFNIDLFFSILRNEMVLIVDEDSQNMVLSKDEDQIKNNACNIFDWDNILLDMWTSIKGDKIYLNEIEDEFSEITYKNIRDFNIIEHGKKTNTVDLSHMCAKILNGNGLSYKRGGDGPIWDRVIIDNVENGTIDNNKIVYYYITEYVKIIKRITEEITKYCNLYNYLHNNKLCNRIPYFVDDVEDVFITIDKFFDTGEGYYHPLCNVEIYTLKEQLMDAIMKCPEGNEFEKYGILKRDINDQYVTAWLSPDGDFYGNAGSYGGLGHMRMADQIFGWTANPIKILMDNDGVTQFGSNSPERWLETHGWMKIHDNECHGTYSPIMSDEGWLPEPTETQIRIMCDYIEKHFNGLMYNEPQILRRTDPIHISKIRQMDKFKLRELFEI